MKVLTYEQLKDKGIPYSRTQLWRRMKAGTFPQSIQLSEQRIAWVEKELDDWLQHKVTVRDRKRKRGAA